MKQWLNENKREVLAVFKQAIRETEQFKAAKEDKSVDVQRLLTPADVAVRWGFHVESVRRLIRRERWPVIRVGSRILIPNAFVEKYESEAN